MTGEASEEEKGWMHSIKILSSSSRRGQRKREEMMRRETQEHVLLKKATLCKKVCPELNLLYYKHSELIITVNCGSTTKLEEPIYLFIACYIIIIYC